ncbi:hypothetical protein KQ944_13490 [Bacillus subtilis]|uniref:hypothetical protein n=1 Tax=Pseudochrobactrum asaccharolyticum TaxID=354351 RepID=UPI001F367115|nr:hypothetical protein [Pseudochrobactrum asaccharolyticum]MCF7646820.1 hypothetical protein [Pseudochrobactrum asaccharolyticum]MCF7672645.1 hypothetical protein [Bacillus subtilis]
MKYHNIALACSLSLLAAMPALAASEKSLFNADDVNRDVVPAGTPAAFEVAFPNAQFSEAKRKIGENTFSFVPLAFIPLSDTQVALVSTGASDCTSQACSGTNSVHYLEHSAGEPQYPYTLKGEWLDVGMSGVMGNPASRWGWSKEIADAPVLYTEAGGTWQGRSCTFAILTELTAKEPVEIARIPLHMSDASSEDKAASFDGEIVAANKGQSITVSYSGSESFQEVYKRGTDGRFQLEGKSRVPEC